ncbi:MAG: hypothetical protein IJT15_03925 [Rickettsiales bacterium]|nr:hypothetical protein [Rickettsiales bacterium]
METIVTDIIQLDSTDGINRLRKLYKGKQGKNISTNNIQCQYKDFTFTINIDDVKIPLKSEGKNDTKIIISKPKNLQFNGQSCNASEEDNKNTITIINNGEELKFENFTFNKQPYDSDKIINKTIFDNIVETGITKAFGYNEFDVTSKDEIEYNFPLHYNAHGIFKIPNRPNNSIDKISIQDSTYDLTDKSAILFTHNTKEKIDIVKDPSKKFQFIVIDVDGKTCFNVNSNNHVSQVTSGKISYATKVKLQYDEPYDQVNKETETQNNNNIFAKIFCCCCNKTSVNKKAEINMPILCQFGNLKGIVV